MTKVYELPNGHRMVADIDESRRVCNITETTLDSLVSKLNYYAEQAEVLDKIRAEIESHCGLIKENHCKYCSYCNSVMGVREILEIIDKYKAESEDKNANSN